MHTFCNYLVYSTVNAHLKLAYCVPAGTTSSTDTSDKTPSTSTRDSSQTTGESTPTYSGKQTTNGDNPQVARENTNDDDGSSDGAAQPLKTPDHEPHPDKAQMESSLPLATAQSDSTSIEQMPVSSSEADGVDKATDVIPAPDDCQPVSSEVSSNDDKGCIETNATADNKQQPGLPETTADQSIHLNGQPEHGPDKERETSAECHDSTADSVSDIG